MTATTTDRLDGLASSTAVKGPCKAASTTNITLSGEQTVNGVSIVADDRVLVTGQTDGTENGVYVAATSVWRRAKDFSSNNDVREGTQVRVNDGTNAGIYVVSTSDPIVFDTSTITLTRDTALTSGALMAANNLSDVASAVAALWNLRNNGASINAAATLVLDNATGDQVDIAGNTTITAVTLTEDREVWCRFTGTPQITVGASLIGNAGGSNITMAAGDIARFRGYAAGVVRFTVFPISGYVTPTSTTTLTNKTITTPTLTLKQSTTPTPTAEGDIQWDTDDNVIAVGDGAATKLFVPIPASTAAGDIEYFSGAKAKARLAKGSASQHLAMNAGATAPEWVTANPVPTTSTLAVGSAAYLFNDGANIANGATAAGSTLYIASFSSSGVPTKRGVQTGTWKNITGATATIGEVAYWVRTA